jgi:hypothetical protein
MTKVNIAAHLSIGKVESADLNSAPDPVKSLVTGREQEIPPPDNPAP